MILAVLLLNAVIGTLQERRAERSLRALSQITSHKVQVLRGGKPEEIDATELVPGDILLLSTGDAISADARIIDSTALEPCE